MISDGRPGHFNQTLGVIRALKKNYDVSLATIETRLRLGFLRPLLRAIGNSRVTWLNALLAPLVRLCYYPFALPSADSATTSSPAPDVIISCGGQTLYLNLLLAQRTGARNFFLGSLRGIHCRLFTAVISGLWIPNVSNLVELELSPGLFDSEQAAQAGAAFLANLCAASGSEKIGYGQKTYWAMLVGGDGAGYQFDDADMAALEALLLAASRRYGIQWLLTTSRRTARRHEQRLAVFAAQNQDIFAYRVFYHEKPEPVVMAFLGAADKVFATEDSSSMISEAIMSRKPVVTLAPRHSNANDNYRRFLHKHRDKNRMISLSLAELASDELDVSFADFRPLATDIDVAIVEQLQPFLGGKEPSADKEPSANKEF